MNQIDAHGKFITLIHFTYEVDAQYHIACMPAMREFGRTNYHEAYMRTNDTRAVNCPACKKSVTFREYDSSNRVG